MDSLHHGPLYGDFLLSISIMQEKRYESKKYHRKMDVYIKRPFLKESNPEDNSWVDGNCFNGFFNIYSTYLADWSQVGSDLAFSLRLPLKTVFHYRSVDGNFSNDLGLSGFLLPNPFGQQVV
jgi:hypothetical protein